GDGRLTMDELDERLNATYAARTHRELERLTADVVVRDAAAPGRMPVRRGEGAKWIVSVLSGHDRKGRWLVGPRLHVVNVLGGSDLDLNEAELAGDRVEMTVFALLGGASVRIPEGLNVEVSDFGLLGGNSVQVGDERPDPGGPTLHLRLISI